MSGFVLKVIALLTMTVDHAGAIFEDVLPSDVYFALRSIGRISFPLFAFNVGVGLKKTNNLVGYILRLAAFAILTHIPYAVAVGTGDELNVMFTFLASALCVLIYKKLFAEKNAALSETFGSDFVYEVFRALGIAAICGILYACEYFHTDYGMYGALLPLLIYFSKNKPTYLLFTALFIYASYSYHFYPNRYFLPTLISLIFIALYNNKKGAYSLKYFFYLYYPLHFAAIWAVHEYLTPYLIPILDSF